MIKKLYNFFKKFDYRLKFLMVGGLNTIVGLGSYWLILLMFGINITKHYDGYLLILIATIISQCIGVLHSYFWNKYFTFESVKKSKIETIKFVSVYLFSFGLDYLLKYLLRLVPYFNDIIIALLTVICTTIVSFVGQRYFVFGKCAKVKNNIDTTNDSDKETVNKMNINDSLNFENKNNKDIMK